MFLFRNPLLLFATPGTLSFFEVLVMAQQTWKSVHFCSIFSAFFFKLLTTFCKIIQVLIALDKNLAKILLRMFTLGGGHRRGYSDINYAVQSGGCRFESLWGFGFFLRGANYEVDYSGKKTCLAGLQCTLTSSCAKR